MAEINEADMEKMMGELDAVDTVVSTAAQPDPDPARVVVGTAAKLKTFFDKDDAARDIQFSDSDLDSVMMSHASLFVHYAMNTVQAQRQYNRLKNAFEILEARLDSEYRRELGEGSAKKPTEAQIRNALVADRRWSGAQSRVIDAHSIWKGCEAIESALCHRKDLILEVARDRRKEREGDLVVRDRQNLRDRVDELLAKKNAA